MTHVSTNNENLTITPTGAQPEVGQVREMPVNFPSSVVTIQVVVMDKRDGFGRVDWLVSPVAGTGSFWTTTNSLMGKGKGASPRTR